MSKTLKRGRASFAVSWLLFATAAPALAQVSTGGLFGATRVDTVSRGKLDAQMSMSEAFDSEVPPEFRDFVPRNDLNFGRSTVFTGSLDYARERRRLQLFGAASTYLRYNHRLQRTAPGSQSLQLGAGLLLPKQGSLNISQSAAYSPSYLYDLFPAGGPLAPGDVEPVNPEYRIDQSDSWSHRSRLSAAFGSARGTRLTTTADYTLSRFQNRAVARPDLTTYSAGATLSRSLSRRGGFSAGYQYRAGEFAFGAQTGAETLTKMHQVTLGLEYTPALSVSRRLTFRLAVSPGTLETPASPLTGAPRRLYPVDGDVSVTYPFRLRWEATASYRRAVQFLAVLSEPVFTDGTRLGVTGIIGRRLDVSALAGYATAASTISSDGQKLGTYTGQARIRFALSRAFALYSEYSFYSYDLGGHARLAPGLPEVYEQHGVRVGFMLFSRALGR